MKDTFDTDILNICPKCGKPRSPFKDSSIPIELQDLCNGHP